MNYAEQGFLLLPRNTPNRMGIFATKEEVGALRQASSLTYALDIGTRTIAGIVMERQEDIYRILAGKIAEQEPRAMQDGQIHDITRVARTIRRVTVDLERKIGSLPHQVAVAAAGRTLRTAIGSISHPISPVESIDRLTVEALEMQAVLRARETLKSNSGADFHSSSNWASEYIFVAYSPMTHYLDEEPIANPVGHRGASIGVDVIATFLPRIVIDSLSASLTAAGLEIGSLTLEPIAAIQAVIPPTMRLLNLALVDVGAGTSDTALTRNGVVFGYGMVSVAGDEITRALCQHYLLDFREGERLKLQYQRKERLGVRNVLGQRVRPQPEEVAQAIKPAVAVLSQAVGEEILRLAGSAPQAVICIGGGSQTPHFPEALAQCLGLPVDRVAVRDRDAITNVEGFRDILSGPDSITPIAIAMNGSTATSFFVPVTVNGRTIRLLSISEPTVREALLAAGIGLKEIRGKPGAALTLTVNGEVEVVPGSMGKPAIMRMDGEVVTLDAPIKSHASLTIEPPQPGEDAPSILRDIVNIPPPLMVQWHGRELAIPPRVMRNGKPASPADRVEDRDVIETMPRKHINDLIDWLQEQGEIPHVSPIRYTLNGTEAIYSQGIIIRVNGVEATGEMELKDGDVIHIEGEPEPLTMAKIHRVWAEQLEANAKHHFITVTFNQKPLTLMHETGWKYIRRNQPSRPDDIIQDGDVLTITPITDSERPEYILSDVFRDPNLAIPEPRAGGRLRILLNGKPAGFTSPIDDGDVIEIGWKDLRS